MPVKMVPVCEPESAMAKAAAVENMTAVKPAAVERCAAAVETTAMEAATMKSASPMEATSTVTASTMTSATMAATTAAGFGRHPVRDVFCDRYSTGIDRKTRHEIGRAHV